MKKILLSFLIALTAITTFAQKEITFKASEDQSVETDAGERSITKDGITLHITNGMLYGANYRFYKNQTLTLSSTIGNITKIVFTCTASGDAQYGPGCFAEQEGYSYEDKTGTWAGSSKEVKFLAATNQIRATSVVVTVGGETPSAPAIEKPSLSLATGTYTGTQEITITAAEGYGVIYTTDGTTPADGNGTYEKSGSAKITINKTTTVKAISVDNDDPDNASSVATSTITLSNNYNTAETALTVGEALKFIAEGKNLDDNVYTKGTICKINEISTSFGNATYYINDGTDTLEVYRGYGVDGAKFTAEDEIGKGDVVIVFGKLVDFKGTYEYTTGSQIVSIDKSGRIDEPKEPEEPETPYELVGAGTLANPYTAEDIVKKIYVEGETVTGVWVKGVIRGCVITTTGNKLSDKEPVNSNIGISTSADSETIIPIQLPYVKENDGALRAAINIVDNADNVGKTVYIYGDIVKYCGVAGLKNPTDYSWDGLTTSVESIKADNSKSVKYSITGQKVTDSYKGITIQKGKKSLVK